VIKKKRKADFLRGAVIALFIAGLGAVLSSAKAQNEEYKIEECKQKVVLEHIREFKRWSREGKINITVLPSGMVSPPSRPPKLDYSKCNKYAPPRPATKKAKTKSIKFDPNKIAAGIDDAVEARAKKRRKAAADQKKILNSLAKEQEERDRVIAVVNNLRHQIEKCWTIPADARVAENLIVRIKVFLNIDGSLSKAPEIVGDRPKTGSHLFNKAAESALMALLKCAPLKNMPADLYPRWRKIILTFNPRSMIGG